VAGAIRDMKIALVFPSVAPYFGARLSLRTMSNSQPAVACGYGEAQQGISKANTQKFGRLEIPCWILDIQSPEKPDGACEITRPA
jgi:hypothetical protein